MIKNKKRRNYIKAHKKKKKELTVIKKILQRINFMRKHLDYYTFKDMEQSEYK